MAFLVCLLFRESIGVAITKSFVIFVRKFFVSSTISVWNHLPQDALIQHIPFLLLKYILHLFLLLLIVGTYLYQRTR